MFSSLPNWSRASKRDSRTILPELQPSHGLRRPKTPNFDRIANKSVKFANAYDCNPKCAPARAFLLTGRYSWRLEVACNHNPFLSDKRQIYRYLLDYASLLSPSARSMPSAFAQVSASSADGMLRAVMPPPTGICQWFCVAVIVRMRILKSALPPQLI